MTRIPTILLLSGPISAGKSVLAENLVQRYGADYIRTSALITASASSNPGRVDLQEIGLRPEFQEGEWVVHAINERVSASNAGIIVVDAARTLEQVEACRRALGISCRVTHIHLMAQPEVLAERFASRIRPEDAGLSWRQAMQAPQEMTAASLAEVADLVVDTTPLTPADVAIRVSAYLHPCMKRAPNVDVLVGGQWGSEGKGNIAFALAPEYDLLVRVGAPNAGHKVRAADGSIYTHRQLPSGTRATNIPVLLGPGAVIDSNVLLREISDCDLSPRRLTIDPRALIIEDEDVKREAELKRAIGSTGTGGGAAVARRIMGRGQPIPVRMARDLPELGPYIGDAADRLDNVRPGGTIFIEGTQGTSLSVLHGSFPHVTSRDTTVGTLLAEVGLPPQSVRHVIMVLRTYPIRVGGQSGPMGREITWQTVAERSGIPAAELLASERGSVSHNQRRVAEFDWTQLMSSVWLNGATDIALTFTDYLDMRNRRARRFGQLTPPTQRFVEEIEMTTHLPVSLISANFDGRGLIDRRHW
jgi:adenylosuccinate synthase